MRRIPRIIINAAAAAVLIPASVLAATQTPLKPVHWSGAVLADVNWGNRDTGWISPPSPWRENLGPIQDVFRENQIDLAGYVFDPDEQEMVIFVADDYGEQVVPERLKDYPYAWRIDRVRYSAYKLRSQQGLISADSQGILRTERLRVIRVGVGNSVNYVQVTVVRLDHDLFWRLGEFGDTAGVEYIANYPTEYTDLMGNTSDNSNATFLQESYLVALTGFPWHIGVFILLSAAVWVMPGLLRRRQRAEPVPTGGA